MNDNFKKKTEQLDALTKPIRNLAWLGALAIAAWVQFIGPGLTDKLRELSGSNDLRHEMQEGFQKTAERLTFIESNIAPPQVAIWNWNRQLDACNENSCRAMHNISRTEYGRNCGVPIAETEIKLLTGEVFKLNFDEGFEEVEATPNGVTVIVPFQITDYIPDGVHSYRFKNVYPTCEWSREPIPRYSPWFDLTVSRDN